MRHLGLAVATGLALLGAAGIAVRLRLGRRVDTLLAAATLATLQVVVTVLFAGLVVRRLPTLVTAGRITSVAYALWSNIFPANGAVVTTWLAVFTHSSVGLALAQLPYGVVGTVAVMSLARTVGVSRTAAVAAGSLFFLTPVV